MKKPTMMAVGPVVLILACVLFVQSCATLDQMAAALANLKRLQFKIEGVNDFRLAGISLGGKTNLTQLTPTDALQLVNAFGTKKLPADFVLNVLAVNPNDGTGGSAKTVSTLTALECRLLIDGKPTVNGNIERPVDIPGTGQATVIPIRLSLDLFEFFSDRRYEDLIGLALALGGANQTPTKVALDALPSVTTPLGTIAYPGRLTIVSTEFR
jgi:hypothetical protein